ncbi:MAG: hypothetical protein JNG84_05240, partial [Archangium sp.]|nr:hypothetical protein [Archangium sp.]
MIRSGALVLAWALGVYAALGGLPTQASHELHLSLAHHALESATTLSSIRWNGGQSMAGHPPLFHQVVALLARVPGVGLERAYAALMALLPVLLTFALSLLVERTSSRSAGHVAAWLCAAHPLLFQYVFPYGQGPFTLGVALALAAGACWATSNSWRGVVAGGALAVASVSSHAAAVVALAVAGVLALCVQPSWKRRVAIIISALVAAGVAVWLLAPFIEAMRAAVATPGSKLLAPRSAVGAIVIGLSMWSAVVALSIGRVPGRVVGVATLACAGLSFVSGRVGVAPDKWVWLAAMCIPMCWAFASEAVERVAWLRASVTAVVALSGATSAWLLGRDDTRYGTRNRALREARAALEEPGAANFRYLTLGVGTERFEMARYVWARSADTGVPWVAAAPLRGTPFLSVDELP